MVGKALAEVVYVGSCGWEEMVRRYWWRLVLGENGWGGGVLGDNGWEWYGFGGQWLGMVGFWGTMVGDEAILFD